VIELIALSDAMREAVSLAERVAATDANVLITGESGSGKDALSIFIHSRSPRAAQPLVKIDCATLPADLLEAELFGYERGAFTGATEAKPGRLEAAHRGTLVLDEIAHLPTDAQAKLLRVIESRQFERLSGRKTIQVDARLIALTNVDLKNAVERRAFRDDLHAARDVELPLPEPGKPAVLVAAVEGGRRIRYELDANRATRVETDGTDETQREMFYFPPRSQLQFEPAGERGLVRLTIEMPLGVSRSGQPQVASSAEPRQRLAIEACPSRMRRREAKSNATDVKPGAAAADRDDAPKGEERGQKN
jgi:hypothetical protein